MKDNLLPSNHLAKLRIKEPVGWFVAGEGFRCALALLSDGAFKLYAHLSLQADRRTGRMTAAHKELAAALGKSKRVVGTYVAELEAKEVCNVLSGKNQFMATVYEISDRYWPYHVRPAISCAMGEGLRNLRPLLAISPRTIISGIARDPGVCRVSLQMLRRARPSGSSMPPAARQSGSFMDALFLSALLMVPCFSEHVGNTNHG